MGIDISIIIPTCNRPQKLLDCLNSLISQNCLPEQAEIIVIDDRQDDKVKNLIARLQPRHPRLKYLSQQSKGPAAARNLGLLNAQGEVVAFVDDDCTVDKDWIRLVTHMHKANPDTVAIGGDTLTATDKPASLVSQFLATCSIQTKVNNKKEVIFFPTCNVSFKRKVVERFKFDERFPFAGGEDLEFFWRLYKAGHRFIWEKKIKVVHVRDDSLHSFIKQAFVYGRGNFLTQHIHGDHPLLKELKAGGLSFWMMTTVNIIKTGRFTYILGRKLITEKRIDKGSKKLLVYLYFIIHKIFYISGNIIEFFNIIKRKPMIKQQKQELKKPRLLILDITHTCNLTCQICDIWKTADHERNLDLCYAQKTIFQAKALGIEEIAVSGGEPLLREDIFDLIAYAQKLKIKNLGILTNGILVEEYLAKLKPYLLDNTACLIISLDSLKPEVHNLIRNSKIAWQKTMQGIRLLARLKQEYPQINFNIISIVLNNNLEELPELAAHIKLLGANSLQLQVLLANNLKMSERGKSPFWIPPDRWPVLEKTLSRLIQFKKDNMFFVKNSPHNLVLMKDYFQGKLNSGQIRCLSAHKTVLVSNQGLCTTCFSTYGDIKMQDLKGIITSQAITKAQEKVKECSWPCLLPCFCDL